MILIKKIRWKNIRFKKYITLLLIIGLCLELYNVIMNCYNELSSDSTKIRVLETIIINILSIQFHFMTLFNVHVKFELDFY